MEKTRLPLQVRRRRWIFGTLSAVMMAVIFWMSAMPARESAEVSGAVTDVAVRVAYPDYPKMPKQRQQTVYRLVQHFVRKSAHFLEYMVLGALMLLLFNTFSWRLKPLWAWLAASAYAATDEWHQAFVAGRGPMATDVLIDASGAALGVILACLTLLLISHCKKKRAQKTTAQA